MQYLMTTIVKFVGNSGLKMDEEERLKQLQEEWKEKIAYYKESKEKISKQLKGKEGRDKEYIRNRVQSCQRLIEDYEKKLNPTSKKEMYR